MCVVILDEDGNVVHGGHGCLTTIANELRNVRPLDAEEARRLVARIEAEWKRLNAPKPKLEAPTIARIASTVGKGGHEQEPRRHRTLAWLATTARIGAPQGGQGPEGS